MADQSATTDAQVNDSVDLVDEQLFTANKKLMLDDQMAHSRRVHSNAEDHDENIAQMALRWADDQHTLVMRIAGGYSTQDQRTAVNASTIDHLAQLGTINAQQSIQAQVAQEAQEAATAAVNAAVAQGTTTSAPAQGTTGLAQGGLQVGQSAANTAMLVDLASNVNELSRLVAILTGKIATES